MGCDAENSLWNILLLRSEGRVELKKKTSWHQNPHVIPNSCDFLSSAKHEGRCEEECSGVGNDVLAALSIQ